MGNVLSGKSMSEHHAVIENFRKNIGRVMKISKKFTKVFGHFQKKSGKGRVHIVESIF
jgi:hypothetical protein